MLVRTLGLCLLIIGVSVAAGFAADITYTYDALGRLTNVAYGCGGSTSYAYDAAGNRTTTSATACSADHPPVAVNDTITTNVNTPITFDPRTNDSDPDNDPLTITAAGPASHGTVVINSGTSLTYTPTTGYTGSDSFPYTISDGRGGTASATVSATVTQPTNQPPIARNDTLAVQRNQPTSYDPRINDNDPDNDPITITAVSTPSHGTATIQTGTQITYTAANGYLGTDSFTYTISDGQGHSVTATETVNVQSTKNQSPNGVNDNVTVTSSPFSFDPRSNDSDPDGDTITLWSVTSAHHGTVVVGPGGQSLIYTKNAGYTGSDNFTYKISDSAGNTSGPTNVTLTVQ